MFKTLQVNVTGMSPMLMHNGNSANPLDPMAKLVKTFTSKRKKTDDDHDVLSKLDFLSSAYMTEPMEVSVSGYKVNFNCEGVFCIPAENWEKALYEGATRIRLGRQAKAALFVEHNALLNDAPSLAAAFKNPNEHYFTKRVKVNNSTVMRTRVVFRKWSCNVEASYYPEVLDERDVREVFRLAGQLVGVCDYRPKYGRFQVN